MPTAVDKLLKQEIYAELAKEIPVDAVQKKSFGDKSEGYNIGYLIERLNRVLIARGWSWKADIMPLQDEQGNNRTYVVNASGGGGGGENASKGKTTISVRVRVTVFDDSEEVVWSKESFGGCQMINNSLGDTLKGAQTDAMKKAFSYLGLGNAAFKGRIDDQLRQYYYKRDHIITQIQGTLSARYNKNITEDLALRYISSVTEKAYESTDDVLTEDWDKVLSSLSDVEEKIAKKPAKVSKTVPNEKKAEEADGPKE